MGWPQHMAAICQGGANGIIDMTTDHSCGLTYGIVSDDSTDDDPSHKCV